MPLIADGFVEWIDGDTSDTSYAISLYPPGYWDIVDVVAVVSEGRKDVSTSEVKIGAFKPLFPIRKLQMKKKLELTKNYLKIRIFLNLVN